LLAQETYPLKIKWSEDISKPVAIENIPDIHFSKVVPLPVNDVVCIYRFISKDESNTEREHRISDFTVSISSNKGVIQNKGERNKIRNIVMQLSHISGAGTMKISLHLPPSTDNKIPGKQVSNILVIDVFSTYPPF
jgi:hypothetical protein